ncbi:hypothetical protein TNCV_1872971 [Trichonephila clavipes]|nr:hypothetical protein TNCV_1872971 [Trichonephila clavipes]
MGTPFSRTQNAVVDVLSRNTVERAAGENVACAIIRDLVLSSRKQLIEEQRRDPELGHIYRYLKNPDDSLVNAIICENWSRDFRLVEGLLFYAKYANTLGEMRVYIPQSLRSEIMREFHDKLIARRYKTYNKIRDARNNNLVDWEARKRLTVNIDQVRLYYQRESDENVIRVGTSDNSGSRYQASSFEGARPRSDKSQYSKNNGSGERREVKGKVTGLKEDQGEGHTSVTSKRRPLIRSSNSSLTEPKRKAKKGRRVERR